MIKIEFQKINKNDALAMLSSCICFNDCVEILIKTKEDLKKEKSDLECSSDSEILRRIGVPCHLLGYQYIQEAVRILTKDPYKLQKFTTIVYGEISAKNGTKSTCVERAIRHAIDVAFEHGDINEIHKFFGSSYRRIAGKPTNKEFIAMLVNLTKGVESEDEN